MKKLLIFPPLLALVSVGFCAADKAVPASPAAAVGLPAMTVSAADDPRIEIEELWTSGKKNLAWKRLDQWMDKEKNSPEPWIVAAHLRFQQKKFKRCVSMAQAAIIKSPEAGEAYFWRGRGFEAMDRLLDAANEYRAALIAGRPHTEAQTSLDRVSNLLGVVAVSEEK